eukprot:612162-Prymnesium_polylepis.1
MPALARRCGTSDSGPHHALTEQKAFAASSDMVRADAHATFDFPGASNDLTVPLMPMTSNASNPASKQVARAHTMRAPYVHTRLRCEGPPLSPSSRARSTWPRTARGWAVLWSEAHPSRKRSRLLAAAAGRRQACEAHEQNDQISWQKGGVVRHGSLGGHSRHPGGDRGGRHRNMASN